MANNGIKGYTQQRDTVLYDFKHDMRAFDRRRKMHMVLRFTLVAIAGMAVFVAMIELLVRRGWGQ